MSNFLKGLSMPNQKPRVRLAAAAAATVAVGTGVALTVSAQRRRRAGPAPQQPQRLLLPQPLVDAICGAVGEVSQIVLLYPLETIKVRCQADGTSAAAVVRQMTANGWSPQVFAQLYAGIGSATAFSVVVGAIHWLTFCTAKRAALQHMGVQEGKAGGASGHGSGHAAGDAASGVVQHAGHHGGGVHVSSAHVVVARDGAKEGAEGAKAHVHISSGHHMHDEEVKLAAGDGAAGCRSEADAAHDMRLVATANMVGATVGAIGTALVEGPLELFRHQAQAGLISGNLFREMRNVVRAQGPMGLYFGFLPYCLESFPYDISELATYSQLRDLYNAAVTRARGSSESAFGPNSRVPQQVWDVAMGAAAGSAATLISMPFDVVKTYMQTHAMEAAGMSAGGQVVEFFRTGCRMVAARGPGALWVGVVPRLAQQVPSCTICWWAVEACQQALKPYTAPA